MEIPKPYFIINEALPDRAHKLESLQEAILANPELLGRALIRHVSVLGPGFADVINSQGDNQSKSSSGDVVATDEQKILHELELTTAEKLWEEVDDGDFFPFIEFDPLTEDVIDQSETFENDRKKWKADKNINQNRFTQRVRIARMTIFLGRVGAKDFEHA